MLSRVGGALRRTFGGVLFLTTFATIMLSGGYGISGYKTAKEHLFRGRKVLKGCKIPIHQPRSALWDQEAAGSNPVVRTIAMAVFTAKSRRENLSAAFSTQGNR